MQAGCLILPGIMMQRPMAAATAIFSIFSLVSVASTAMAQNAPQEQPAPAPQTSQPWQVQCVSRARETPPDCVLAQGVAIGGRPAIKVNIRVPGETRKPLMIVQTPLNSLLTAGVTLDVDGAGAIRLEYRSCDTNGCYANSPVSNELLQALFRGRMLNLTIQSIIGRPAKVSIDLNGFTAAYQSIR